MSVCTCTTGPACLGCRPPCEWVIGRLGEIPVRCGDQFATRLGELPVCIDHYQASQLDRESDFVNTAGMW